MEKEELNDKRRRKSKLDLNETKKRKTWRENIFFNVN